MSYPDLGKQIKNCDLAFDADGKKSLFGIMAILCDSDSVVEPGLSVRFIENSNKVEPCSMANRHGIVDPFLKQRLDVERRFWVLIDPEHVEKFRIF